MSSSRYRVHSCYFTIADCSVTHQDIRCVLPVCVVILYSSGQLQLESRVSRISIGQYTVLARDKLRHPALPLALRRARNQTTLLRFCPNPRGPSDPSSHQRPTPLIRQRSRRNNSVTSSDSPPSRRRKAPRRRRRCSRPSVLSFIL